MSILRASVTTKYTSYSLSTFVINDQERPEKRRDMNEVSDKTNNVTTPHANKVRGQDT